MARCLGVPAVRFALRRSRPSSWRKSPRSSSGDHRLGRSPSGQRDRVEGRDRGPCVPWRPQRGTARLRPATLLAGGAGAPDSAFISPGRRPKRNPLRATEDACIHRGGVRGAPTIRVGPSHGLSGAFRAGMCALRHGALPSAERSPSPRGSRRVLSSVKEDVAVRWRRQRISVASLLIGYVVGRSRRRRGTTRRLGPSTQPHPDAEHHQGPPQSQVFIRHSVTPNTQTGEGRAVARA